MLDVGTSGEFLFHMHMYESKWTVMYDKLPLFRWVCQHQADLSKHYRRVWKGRCPVLQLIKNCYFPHRALKTCRIIWDSSLKAVSTLASMTARTSFLWWRALCWGEPSCPTMEWPRKPNLSQLFKISNFSTWVSNNDPKLAASKCYPLSTKSYYAKTELGWKCQLYRFV